jgi:hypothetical protein
VCLEEGATRRIAVQAAETLVHVAVLALDVLEGVEVAVLPVGRLRELGDREERQDQTAPGPGHRHVLQAALLLAAGSSQPQP